jgi:ABC-2 type transport system ATP-binding protein
MVQVQELSFGYRRQPLFADLALELRPGNIYGLLGKNGAGKTTLLRLLAGLLFPDQGECAVMGYAAKDRLPGMLQDVFFLPEEFSLPPLRIGEYAALYGPFYPKFDETALKSFVREFELDATRRLTTMSYGQRKKFLLAFGLASGTRLLLLDEPSNGLDIPSKGQFRRLVASSLTDERTFLISTHQVRDVENLIDPIIILDEGRIIFEKTLAEIAGKIAVRVVQQVPNDVEVLYADKGLGGYVIVTERGAEPESQIDLEVLFNAVLGDRSRMQEIFKEGGPA